MPKQKVVVKDLSLNTFGVLVPGSQYHNGGLPYYAVLLKDKARTGWRECIGDAIGYYQDHLQVVCKTPSYFPSVHGLYAETINYLRSLYANT